MALIQNTPNTALPAIARPRRPGKAFHYDDIAKVVATLDVVLIVASSVVSGLLYHWLAYGMLIDPSQSIGVGLTLAAAFVLVMSASGLYQPTALLSFGTQFKSLFLAGIGIVTFMTAVAFFLKIGGDFSRVSMGSFTVLALSTVAVSRLVWRDQLRKAMSHGLFQMKRALLICGDSFNHDRLAEEVSHYGMAIQHVLRCPNDDFSSLAGAFSAGIGFSVDEVLVATPYGNLPHVDTLLTELRALPLPIKVVVNDFAAELVSQPIQHIGGLVAFEIQRRPLTLTERFMKRAFDMMFAAMALIALAIPFIFVAIAIKLDSKGPVFFRQQRRGYNNEAFRIVKFRSMRVQEDGDTVTQARRQDSRITKVGRFIRATSIDELPQFWNVLCGHMSIVGPRPHAVAHDREYDQMIRKYTFRRHAKPGLTGWAQINGHRGETPTLGHMEARLNYDLWYIHNWSLFLDMRIIGRTVLEMINSKSAY
ncbi:undecaprenyl-phosphate glucose phosphotransferase [Aureimonas fodinaquatilis]|nr:undecaprenyl-phosphate glucose phosphotransferase [Aureimonas fodinaquatilis]